MPIRRLALPLVVALAALALWNTFVVYPFRVFVVFLHEISHGIAALLTGGRILAIGLTFDEGGVCVTDGGNRFLILNAGYLGSLFWGVLLLRLGARRGRASGLVSLMGAFTLVVTVIYVRTIFGIVYGLATGTVRRVGRRFRRALPRVGGERRQRPGPHHSVSRLPLGTGLGGRLRRHPRPHASLAGPGQGALAAEPPATRGRTMKP